MRKILAFTISIFLLLGISQAQEVKKSDKIIDILGKKFYLHTVKKGETIYAISKCYGVSQQDIVINNPTVSQNLKQGVMLKIPVKSKLKYVYYTVPKRHESVYSIAKKFNVSQEALLRENPELKNGVKKGMILRIPVYTKQEIPAQDIVYHKVKKGETLFSISQKYGVGLETITSNNPGSDKNLSEGQILKIPVSVDNTEIADNQSDNIINLNNPLYFIDPNYPSCDQFEYSNDMTFEIALLLPLFIDENFDRSYTNNGFIGKTFRFYDFYQGVLVALDDLRQNGLSINLHVYDTRNDTNEVKKIMSSYEMQDMDLIIGPVYSKNVSIASRYATQYRINMVSPLSQKERILNNNPFVFQVNPSISMLAEKSADYLSTLYDSSIVVIHRGQQQEVAFTNILRDKLVRKFYYDDDNAVVFKILDTGIYSESTIEDALSVGLNNIVIIPSNDEVFVTKVITLLNNLVIQKNYSITLMGMPSWERFANIDLDYFLKLKLFYPSATYLNMKDSRVRQYRIKYRNIYNTDPTAFSYTGYDIMFYFGNVLKKYGKYFQFCISPTSMINGKYGLFLNFEFERIDPVSGFENTNIFLLKYDENMDIVNIEN